MNRITGLILALSVGAAMSAGTASAQGIKPKDDKSTKEASRALGIAMLKQKPEERQQLFQQALQHAMAAVQAQPQNPRGWFLAGQAYANLEDFAGADSAFAKAVELYPAYGPEVEPEREAAWVAAYNTAIVAYQANDLPKAIAGLEAADRMYKKRPEARLNLGAFYAQEEQNDKAIEAFRGALEILRDPANAVADEAVKKEWADNEEMAALNLAQLLGMANRHAEAEKVYREFIARYPNHLNAQVSLATSLSEQGKAKEAAEIYAKLNARTDLTDANYLMIGIGLFQVDDFEGAAAAFRTATGKNPSSRDGYYNLAQSQLMRAGKLEDARKAAKGEPAKAIEAQLTPLYEEIVQATDKVRQFDPFNRDILAYSARAYQALSQLAADPKKKADLTGKVQATVKEHEAFPFEVTDVSIQTGENEVRVSGTVKNIKVTAGQPIVLRFTVLAAGGAAAGSEQVTVTAPAVDGRAQFKVTIPTSAEMAGWKYEQVK
jgi:tetratricopeptide (TPR) repeat protein